MSEYSQLFQRVHNELAELFACASPGEKLPSEPDLSKLFGVSRTTLREVMRTFEIRGVIRRRQGSGTFVVNPIAPPDPLIDSGLEVLESLESLAKRNSLQVSMGELSIQIVPARDELIERLAVEKDTPLVRIGRVISAERRPVAYLVDTLPHDILSWGQLKTGFSGSVLDFLLQRGAPSLSHSFTEVNSVAAPAEIARALQIQRGDVLTLFMAQLFTDAGRMIDYSLSYFIPGFFRFHVIRRVDVPEIGVPQKIGDSYASSQSMFSNSLFPLSCNVSIQDV